MIIEQMPVATQAGHWYTQQGEAAYTIMGNNGKLRPTTLRDARKHNLVPSVTTVCKILDKPGLANWIADQIIMASLTLPRKPDESDKEYIERIKVDSNERRDKAAERGTSLHTDIERFIQGKEHGHPEHVQKVHTELLEVGIDLLKGNAERCFAHADGFGGKIDWSDDSTVLDFKSKDSIENEKKLAWQEHIWQLASYGHGLGITNPNCLNVFVGIDDCKVVIVRYEPEEIRHGLEVFMAILNLWKVKNKIV